ncbi:peptidase U32 family protein [Desulfovermiculus halophilus]|jgi:putative protease|uniref:peptidase U32 family protein n=1 Tax=Desulfovermiculus halophilus TaxID=339722 RepID=UPI00068481B5|nr:peptidase U32 family protein [Desulfovermiculus halophilus]
MAENDQTHSGPKPEILAPVGGADSFLAGISAGADSIYCGLKHFSARMQAENFSIPELARLTALAREQGIKTYIAFNSLVKPGELEQAGRLLQRITVSVQPQAIIVQDLALVNLARQVEYTGQIHLSTLAAMTSALSLPMLPGLDISRVVLPRELSIDEVKTMADSCPEDLELEVFVHGALCYAVSGRCYWSSFLGGKSGLRGRCVQPCRRLYTHRGKTKRYFSCLDLSLDVLTKLLLDIPQVKAWKIEGRKKGPHYVFYAVRAYQLLRDFPQDPGARKTALDLLNQSLGRPGTHYRFLPQRVFCPVNTEKDTGSGQLVGKVNKSSGGSVGFTSRAPLLAGDLLRIGSEDLPGHTTYKISAFRAKGKKIALPARAGNIAPGSPVVLIDRREPELADRLRRLHAQLQMLPKPRQEQADFSPRLPRSAKVSGRAEHVHVRPRLPEGRSPGSPGLWLSPVLRITVSKTVYPRIWFWLPPVIWPEEEDRWARLIRNLVRNGAKKFCCNAPWQAALFEARDDLSLWAGPYCNAANALCLEELRSLGFSGAVASPELSGADLLSLPRESPLPLGIVLSGPWPLCVARSVHQELHPGSLIQSPKKEPSYIQKKGPLIYHFPNWELDLSPHQRELEDAGYRLFVHLHERRPQKMPPPTRVSSFNWDLQLL